MAPSLRHRLMTLIRWLRNPHAKPPVTEDVDRRLDRVERRLERVITTDGARNTREIVRHG